MNSNIKQKAGQTAGNKLNPEAWVDEYGDYLFRYALGFVRNESLAEDLVQEALLAALKGQSSFQGKSSVKTWLTSVLKHKIIDNFRKRYRTESLPDEEIERQHNSNYFNEIGHWADTSSQMGWDVDPDKALEQKEFLNALDSCLSKLPDRVRELFLLREVEGHRRKDLANKLGLTATNIGVLLHRARLDLRECLGKNWLRSEG